MANRIKSILLRGMLAFVVLLAPQAQAAKAVEIEVGYMPILPVSQLFVALENGWLTEAGIQVRLVQFQNGPAMVQALLAGQLDVAHFGIGPAMVARAKGVDIKVVAASIAEQISLVASPELAPYFVRDAATAFARFRADKGRKAKISTFPVGSVPQTVLQYWLQKNLQVKADDIEIIYQGAAQVQQSLQTGAVDGAAVMEPIVADVIHKLKGARVVAQGSEMFAGQPGAVLAVRERLIAEQPAVVQSLVAIHDRATRLLNEQPVAAVDAVQKYVGGGRMPKAIVAEAIAASKGQFVADPKRIIEGTRRMRDFQLEMGTLKDKLDIDALFATRFYDALGR